MLLTAKIKEELAINKRDSALELLSTTIDRNVLKVFKEQKMLLRPVSIHDLIQEYERAAKRIMSDVELEYERNYLKFLVNYRDSTSMLEGQIEQLLKPLLNKSLKEFLVLVSMTVNEYCEEFAGEFYKKLGEESAKILDVENLNRVIEARNLELKGSINDVFFAKTRLINLFVKFQSEEEVVEYAEINNRHTQLILDAIVMSANLNSYQFAFDKLSYGEWFIKEVKIENDKQTFTFLISDVKLEKALNLGFQRDLISRLLGRKKIRWLAESLQDFALNVFDKAWEYYQDQNQVLVTRKSEYEEAQKRVLQLLDQLDAEDELLVGTQRNSVEVLSPYFISIILNCYIIVADCLKDKSKRLTYDLTCPEIPEKEILKIISQLMVFEKPLNNCLSVFISTLPLKQHQDLFKAPFVRDKTGRIFAIDHLSEGNWVKEIRSILMRGGKTADLVGKSWEGYIATTFKENGWKKVIQSLKLKKDKKIVTDLDILALKDNLLLIIQLKVNYSTGANHFEHWKFKEKLIKGVHQLKMAENEIRNDINVLKLHFNQAELTGIEMIQPVVMTNSHFYNGWVYENVHIMSTGSLMQILNGATVKYTGADGSVFGEKKYASSSLISSEEFISFIKQPLDWRIANSSYDIEYKTQDLGYSHLLFPFFQI